MAGADPSATMVRGYAEPSVQSSLLRRLALPLLGLVLLDGLFAYAVAVHFSRKVYDHWLYDSARTVTEDLRLVDGRARLSLPAMAVELYEWDISDRTYFAVVSDKRGVVLGHPEFPQPSPLPPADLQPAYYDAVIDTDSIRAVALRRLMDGDAVTVLLGETRAKRTALTRDIVLAILLPQLLLAGLALLLVWRAIRGSFAPLAAVANEIARRRHGDLQPLDDPGPVEVQPLTRALNGLFRALSSAQSAQRRFIANAAHQLRTPLAALQVQAERALREPNPEAHAEALQHVVAGTGRLSHLARQLLVLARAEPDSGAELRFAPVDLVALARAVTMEWVPRAFEREIDLGLSAPEHPLPLDGDDALLRELLANLIDNAIRYGRPGGTITVKLCETEAALRLVVEDDGPGIPEASRDAVFERFVRIAGSRGDGCGLGLAIVREIAALHGALSRVIGRDGGGARFEIDFPRGSGRRVGAEPRP